MGGCCSKLREGDYFEQVLYVERDEREREQKHGFQSFQILKLFSFLKFYAFLSFSIFIHEKQSNGTRRLSWPQGLLIDPYAEAHDSEISSKSSTARKRVTFSELPNETYAWGQERISLRSYDEFPPPVLFGYKSANANFVYRLKRLSLKATTRSNG